MQELTKSARRALYALIGVGLHGCNRMDPPTALETHMVWSSCKGDPYLVMKATVRAKMLVGRYPVQATQPKFANHIILSVCRLCQTGEEDLLHSCPALEHVYKSKIQCLMELYRENQVYAPRTRGADMCNSEWVIIHLPETRPMDRPA